MSKFQEIQLLKTIRQKIDFAGKCGLKEQYHVEGDAGDRGWMDYLQGIRDALLTVDEHIAALEETHPCEECDDMHCDECPYGDD